jgi:uncharacterized protein
MNSISRNSKIEYIEFPVNDAEAYQKTKSFYINVFNWKYQDWGNDYSDTKDSGIGSGINADSSHNTKNTLVVIYAGDIEEKKNEVIKFGGIIVKDIFSFPGGRRFHFTDPSGNELSVWSDK